MKTGISRRSLAPNQGQGLYPGEIRETYQRLITKKFQSGLTPTEENELAMVRQAINSHDRLSDRWLRQERAASDIDQIFADLRKEIEALPEAEDVSSPHSL